MPLYVLFEFSFVFLLCALETVEVFLIDREQATLRRIVAGVFVLVAIAWYFARKYLQARYGIDSRSADYSFIACGGFLILYFGAIAGIKRRLGKKADEQWDDPDVADDADSDEAEH